MVLHQTMQNFHAFIRPCTCQLESFCSVYFLWPCCGVDQASLCLSGGGLMVHQSSVPHHVFFSHPLLLHAYFDWYFTTVPTNCMWEMAVCPSNRCTSIGLRPLLNEWPPFSRMILNVPVSSHKTIDALFYCCMILVSSCLCEIFPCMTQNGLVG